jgi:hypothetical protein
MKDKVVLAIMARRAAVRERERIPMDSPEYRELMKAYRNIDKADKVLRDAWRDDILGLVAKVCGSSAKLEVMLEIGYSGDIPSNFCIHSHDWMNKVWLKGKVSVAYDERLLDPFQDKLLVAWQRRYSKVIRLLRSAEGKA